MPDLQVVDAYLHLVDRSNPDLRYAWLEPGAHNPGMGEPFESLKTQSLLAEDYIRDALPANVLAWVCVEVATGTKDPVKETAWLQAAAGRTGFPQASVAFSNLR